MSSLIVLHQVRVENANAIAGLTYGFPAITHFLGYSHALSRKLQSSHGLTLRVVPLSATTSRFMLISLGGIMSSR